MSIFRRHKGQGEASDGTAPAAAAPDPAVDADGAEGATGHGPFDRSEVQDPEGRLDLGSLWVAGVEGMELRLEIDQQEQVVTAVTAAIGDSALQVQAFAAPRSSGLWEEIRAEISESIEQAGGTTDLAEGPFGTELRTRMPSAGPDGRTVFAPARFLGVDGRRWFLRGVLSGRAAIEDAAAAPLLAVFGATVVVRGSEPMAPRELLPLRLPETDEALAAEDEGGAQQGAQGLDPFERGPEITEVR